MLPAFFAKIWEKVVLLEKIQGSIMKTDAKLI